MPSSVYTLVLLVVCILIFIHCSSATVQRKFVRHRATPEQLRLHRLKLQRVREARAGNSPQEPSTTKPIPAEKVPDKPKVRAEIAKARANESIEHLWTNLYPMREMWLEVPRRMHHHRYQVDNYVTDVLYFASKKSIRLRTNVPCDAFDNSLLYDDNNCLITTKSSNPFTMILAENPKPTCTTHHWPHCTVFGASGVLEDHNGEVLELNNTKPFEVNRHNVIKTYTEFGENVGKPAQILHASHFGKDLVKMSQRDDTFAVMSVLGHFEALTKAKATILNCNSYAYIAMLKRRFMWKNLHWESYCGTNAVFSLVGRCDEVDVYGFFDTEHAIDTKYGVNGDGHAYGGNHGDYTLMLLLHSCGMINLKY